MTRSTSPGRTETPRFVSVAAAAQVLGVSTATLYRAIATGEFPAIRIRNRLIVPVEALDQMHDAALDQHF